MLLIEKVQYGLIAINTLRSTCTMVAHLASQMVLTRLQFSRKKSWIILYIVQKKCKFAFVCARLQNTRLISTAD